MTLNIQYLKQVIIDQQTIKLPSNLTPRKVFQQALELQKNNQIIIISGLRRCGKSTLMQIIRSSSKEQNYYINFDDERLVQFTVDDFQTLYEIFIELFGKQKIFYFDEIQNIPGWERFIRRLHDQGNKVYITGSNATMFSKELGTRLTGRYIQIELYPFSFAEQVCVKHANLCATKNLTSDNKGNLRNLFANYLAYGGIPEFTVHKQQDYLHFLYESILYRDILARYKVNERALKELVFYLASNIAKEITYNSLRKLLKLGSATTIADYCSYLEESFLCFFINRFAFSIRQQIQYAKKVYWIDHALAQIIGFRFSDDRGRVLENIVFLELKRRYNEIYFHKQNKECDFLIKNGTKIVAAIQVCAQLNLNDETRQREINGLLEALQMYELDEGFIITEHEASDEEIHYQDRHYKIHIIPITEWLVN